MNRDKRSEYLDRFFGTDLSLPRLADRLDQEIASFVNSAHDTLAECCIDLLLMYLPPSGESRTLGKDAQIISLEEVRNAKTSQD